MVADNRRRRLRHLDDHIVSIAVIAQPDAGIEEVVQIVDFGEPCEAALVLSERPEIIIVIVCVEHLSHIGTAIMGDNDQCAAVRRAFPPLPLLPRIFSRHAHLLS